MAKRRIEVDIVANDQASSIFAKVKNNASGMASHLTTVLDGSIKFERSLRNYNNAMYGFNRVVHNVMRTAGDSIYNFTKDAINNFSELERQHAKTMGAMATDYAKTAEAQAKFLADSEKLKQQAIQIGSYGVNGKGALNTVTDVSYAQTALIKSGLSADDILGTNVVESILKFAGGNDLDVDTATTFAVNLGTVFDKPIQEWGKMLDMVTKAADISVIDVEDIMASLTYSGGIASGLGRDLEEILGVISVMGQAGLRGRIAGTGLQAFFTRILSAGELSDAAAGSAPTDYVAQMYDAFIAEAVNADGSFKDMDEVAALLNTAMDSLSDQEQAWFAKKLFGLYQMKAAYALTGAVDGDINLITDFINQITNQSAGTNDIKYELMQGSQYGKITSLKNAWEGIKTDFGDRLSPVVSTVADELLTFLSNDGNYDINWNALRDAFDKSGDLISAKYGEEIGQAVANIGNLGIDAGMITSTMIPYAGGLINGIALLLQGDIFGALESFNNGLEDTNEAIEDLPPELQGSATAARNVITAFTALSGINLATKIIQIITTAFNTFFAKPIKWALGKVTSTKTDVTAGTSTITVGTATTVNIGSVATMNVVASVVNIIGGTPTTPGTPNTPGGTPTLPSGGTPILPGGGGGILLLPGVGGTPTLPSGGTPTLPSGGTPILPAAGAGAAGAADDIVMYSVGGKFMTKSQIIKTIAGKASLAAFAVLSPYLFGSPGLTWSADDRIQNGSDWIDRYVMEGNTDYDRIRHSDGLYYFREKYGDNYTVDNVKEEMQGRTAARSEMMAYYKSGAGAEFLDELFKAQIEENGNITEEFLTSIIQWTKDGYTYTGSNDDIKEILKFMYGDFNAEDPWYGFDGRFNEGAIDEYLKNSPTLKFEPGVTLSDLPLMTHMIDGMKGALGELKASSAGNPLVTHIIDKMEDMLDSLQAPNITVNVTTNVDKNGNATSEVNVDSMSRSIARRSSQYGQSHMIN